MLPAVAALLQAGVPLLANALLAKGADVVQGLTGIKIDAQATGITPEDATRLREVELLHQRELLKIAQDDLRIDLAYFDAEVRDRVSAREREAQITSSAFASMLQKNIVPALALIVVACTFSMYGVLTWAVGDDVGQDRKEVILYILGALTAALSQVLGYFFGSTARSAIKDETIRSLSEKRDTTANE